MRRDNLPIHNIGFGATSRDFPPSLEEDIGPSPNSGFVARALEGNPIVRMATALVATGIAATVAGKVVRGQGIKLGFKLTQAAQAAESAGKANALTKAHTGMLKIRSILDELEGVTRVKDPKNINSLVFKDATRTTHNWISGRKRRC